jgi:hypothetical protein
MLNIYPLSSIGGASKTGGQKELARCTIFINVSNIQYYALILA